MNREEILEKSRQENQGRDERERSVQIQGDSFSLLFVFGLGLILAAWKQVHGLPAADVLSMCWMSCAASRIYRLAQRRSASDMAALLVLLAFLAYNLIQFFTQG